MSTSSLPNCFILGAPKCGTTSIANWLGQHPQCFSPIEKEPHYFYPWLGAPPTLTDYLYFYSGSTEFYRIDASVFYLFSGSAVQKIVRHCDNPKFIVCLRNPADMFLSLHSQYFKMQIEKIKDPQEAWEIRKSGELHYKASNRRDINREVLKYPKVCSLGQQVSTLRQNISDDSVMFIWLEDIRDNPGRVWERMLSHLDLYQTPSEAFPHSNPARTPRSAFVQRIITQLGQIKQSLRVTHSFGIATKLAHINSRIGKPQNVNEDFYRKLIEYFNEDYLELCAEVEKSEQKKLSSN